MAGELARIHQDPGEGSVSLFLESLTPIGMTLGDREVCVGAIALSGRPQDTPSEADWQLSVPGMQGAFFAARVSGEPHDFTYRVWSRIHVPGPCMTACVDMSVWNRFVPSEPPETDRPILSGPGRVSTNLLPSLAEGAVVLDIDPEILIATYVNLAQNGHTLTPLRNEFPLARLEAAPRRREITG